MLNRGAAILVSVGRTKQSSSTELVKIKFDKINKSCKTFEALGKALGPNFAENLYFGGLTFERKRTRMKYSRNMKFTHTVN